MCLCVYTLVCAHVYATCLQLPRAWKRAADGFGAGIQGSPELPEEGLETEPGSSSGTGRLFSRGVITFNLPFP